MLKLEKNYKHALANSDGTAFETDSHLAPLVVVLLLLAIASAGQEGPFTWTSMLLWAYCGSATDDYSVSATQGRKLGLTGPKRLLAASLCFFPWGCTGPGSAPLCLFASAAPQFQIALAFSVPTLALSST